MYRWLQVLNREYRTVTLEIKEINEVSPMIGDTFLDYTVGEGIPSSIW